MKTRILVSVFLLAALVLGAVPADVTYTEGDTVIKVKAGTQHDAQIGDTLNTGDTLRTGDDGLAELAQAGVTIKISKGTVFTLMEREVSGKTTSVLSVALGSVKYRYDKLTGSEPMVRTNGAVAGVRGTEFTVYSGADGSTLIAVDSGQVTVESAGQSVDLGASEGVTVPLGKPPGEKVTVHADQIDYKTWNDDRIASLLQDPMAALDSIQAEMDSYVASVTDYAARFADSSKNLAAERANRDAILQQKGKDEAAKYQDQVVTPLALTTGYLFLNTRFYALAALSLRRFVAGRLYVTLKARALASPADPTWKAFLDRYQALLQEFETSIVPQLTAADI